MLCKTNVFDLLQNIVWFPEDVDYPCFLCHLLSCLKSASSSSAFRRTHKFTLVDAATFQYYLRTSNAERRSDIVHHIVDKTDIQLTWSVSDHRRLVWLESFELTNVFNTSVGTSTLRHRPVLARNIFFVVPPMTAAGCTKQSSETSCAKQWRKETSDNAGKIFSSARQMNTHKTANIAHWMQVWADNTETEYVF